MARARKSHDSGEEDVKTHRGKLEPAQSSRVDGHRYVIYASLQREGDPYARVIVLKFLATYAARYMVDKLIGTEEWEWAKWPEYPGADARDDMVVTASGVKIRAAGSQMKDILNHELTEAEAEYRDDFTLASCQRFKFGRHEAANDRDRDEVRDADDPEAGRDDVPELPSERRADKPVKQPREPKPDKPKFDTTGYISANTIAGELKVEGREVRGVLRALKLEKPDHGWSWPKKEAAVIKEKIIAGLKEAKKGKKK